MTVQMPSHHWMRHSWDSSGGGLARCRHCFAVSYSPFNWAELCPALPQTHGDRFWLAPRNRRVRARDAARRAQAARAAGVPAAWWRDERMSRRGARRSWPVLRAPTSGRCRSTRDRQERRRYFGALS